MKFIYLLLLVPFAIIAGEPVNTANSWGSVKKWARDKVYDKHSTVTASTRPMVLLVEVLINIDAGVMVKVKVIAQEHTALSGSTLFLPL